MASPRAGLLKDPWAYEIKTIPKNFDGLLSAADIDVQKALETIDDITHGVSFDGLVDIHIPDLSFDASTIIFEVDAVKTGGASDHSDYWVGVGNYLELDQSGGEVGYISVLDMGFTQSAGNIGDASNPKGIEGIYIGVELDYGYVYGDVYGFDIYISHKSTHSGISDDIYAGAIYLDLYGNVADDVRAYYASLNQYAGTIGNEIRNVFSYVNLDGGTVSGWAVHGAYIVIDQESGHTLNRAYGLKIWADFDGTVNTHTALLFLEGYSNVDYAIWVLDATSPSILGPVFVNDSATTDLTIGITINSGSAYGNMLFKSSTVAHGMTNNFETDSFAWFGKYDDTGALEIDAMSGGSEIKAFIVYAVAGAESNTHSTGASAPVVFDGAKKNGTDHTALTSDNNILAIRNHGSTMAIFGADGDLYLDTALNQNAWDEYDDVALLSGFRGIEEWVEYAKPILEKTGVVTYNDDGHHFISMKRLNFLQIDAIRQLHGRITRLEEQVCQLQSQ